jgi:hypothetical protein
MYHAGFLPRNGVYNRKVPAIALLRGWNKSAEVPAQTGKDAPPKKPAKNRRMQSAVMLGANPAAILNSALIGGDMRYVPIRPIISLIGALSIGPKDKPKTYVVRGTVAMVSETPKSNMTSGTAGV